MVHQPRFFMAFQGFSMLFIAQIDSKYSNSIGIGNIALSISKPGGSRLTGDSGCTRHATASWCGCSGQAPGPAAPMPARRSTSAAKRLKPRALGS